MNKVTENNIFCYAYYFLPPKIKKKCDLIVLYKHYTKWLELVLNWIHPKEHSRLASWASKKFLDIEYHDTENVVVVSQKSYTFLILYLKSKMF